MALLLTKQVIRSANGADEAREAVKAHGLLKMKAGGIPYTACRCDECRELRAAISRYEFKQKG